MDGAAGTKRVLGLLFVSLLIAGLSGCAGSRTATVDTMAEPHAMEQAGPGELASTDLMEPATITTANRILSSGDEGELAVELIEADSFNRVVIGTNQDMVEYEVSRLSSPSRLVIDVLNQDSRTNKVFETEDAQFVSSIRLGAHPDKSRIVLDISDSDTLLHNVEPNGSQIVVTLAEEQNMELALAAPLAATADSVDELITQDPILAQLDPEGVVAEQPFESPPAPALDQNDAITEVDYEAAPVDQAADQILEEDTAAPAALENEAGLERTVAAKPAEIINPQLTEMRIEPIGSESNMLIVQMEAAGFFSIKKTAPSEWILRLENAEVPQQMTRPVLAPPGGGEIRSARATKEDKDVLVRIFANPNVLLNARAQSGKIIVSAVYDDDLRAQFDPNGDGNQNEEVGDGNGNGNPNETEIAALFEDAPKYTGRLISLDLQDTDIDNALRIIAEVSNLNIIASDEVSGKVTLRLIDVPWDQALDVILKTNGLDKVQEGNVIRIAPVEKLRQEREALKQAQQAEEELEPLAVRYIRVSYAKAADLQPLVESVITERGTVTYDERTNQLIVKDINRGIKNVAVLVSKLDLRTPQVLLETQIVESTRNLLRDLGTELGFEHIQSPETGNPTGSNFPNSITIAGSVDPSSNVGTSFPASVSAAAGSAVSFLLGSADGTKTLDARISALETEGRARIVSRPSVATTNNTQATIKSVEKIRVKTPSGGLSVATGSGASAQGTSAIATEVIEVGIILEVTPQASPDYYVLLDIDAKSSTLGSNVVEGIPSEVERSATSTVLVSSGQTFAMGGIYKISDNDNVDGVPFFKDIPFVGHLFRRSLVNNSDEELIFFITPRIIEGSFDDASMRAAS